MVEILNQEHPHPAFPQPVDRNAAIWRYQDFGRFEQLVETRGMYMRRSDKFDKDEFEGTTPQGEIDYWQKRADEAPTEEDRASIINAREQQAEYAAHFREHYFVVCWNMDPQEDVSMWERYTNGPESIAIKSRYGTLVKQLHFGVTHVGQVTYIDYSVSALPGMNMMHRIMHKRHFFRKECEVRAVVWSICPDDVKIQLIDPYMTVDGFGYATPVNPQELIEAVILHPHATPEFSAKVAAFCAKHSVPAPIPSAMAGQPKF